MSVSLNKKIIGSASSPLVGVLALQGDFARHLEALKALGVSACEVRHAEDLANLDGLILPGGESTTIELLCRSFEMWEPLRSFVAHKPVWGTCAGLILLSREVVDSDVRPLGVLDVTVSRNAFGRQVHSFEENITISDGETTFETPACFIRAPKIVEVGPGVTILARRDSEPVLLREGNILAGSFHTELHENLSLTDYFISRFVMKKSSSIVKSTVKSTEKNLSPTSVDIASR